MSIALDVYAKSDPQGMALLDERRRISWSEADIILTRAVNGLLGLDLDAGRHIAIFAENSVETAMAHLACIVGGMSSVPISFHLTADEAAYILNHSGAKVLFVGPETCERGIAAARAAGIELVIGWRLEHNSQARSWEEWLAAQPDTEPPTDMRPLPFLHYTSGTTGRPKGTESPPQLFAGGDTIVEHIERLRAKANNMAALLPESEVRKSKAQLGGRPTDLIVNPMYHTGALNSVRGLIMGSPVVILSRFDAEKTLEVIDKYRIAGAIMVPTQFIRLLALPEPTRAKYDVSSLKLIVHTGAACPPEVKRKMIEWWGPVFVEAYGATETGSTNTINSAEWLDHPGSVGRTQPPFEVLVLGENLEPMPVGEVGYLYFSDSTGRGIQYHNAPEQTAAAHIRPGVFTFGEMGYVNAEGYVYITDRASDMIVSGGVNIYPVEIEQLLIEHPGVSDVAVIGVPHPEFGEQVKALIIPNDVKAPPQAEELIEFCRGRVANYKIPRSVDIVQDIGRTSMGKVNKRTLRARYWPTERTIG